MMMGFKDWLTEQDYKANWISSFVGYLIFAWILTCYLFPRILVVLIFLIMLNWIIND